MWDSLCSASRGAGSLDEAIPLAAQCLWTSARKLRDREFCSIVNDALRVDYAPIDMNPTLRHTIVAPSTRRISKRKVPNCECCNQHWHHNYTHMPLEHHPRQSAQSMHVLAGSCEYLPKGQAVHSDTPCAPNLPAGHSSHSSDGHVTMDPSVQFVGILHVGPSKSGPQTHSPSSQVLPGGQCFDTHGSGGSWQPPMLPSTAQTLP